MTATHIALVTGGNRGIGLEICRQLAQHKDIHVLLGSRNLEQGQQAAANLKERGLNVTPWELDTSAPDSIQNAMRHIESTFGRLDILVNNAGVLLDQQRQQGSVFQVTVDTIRETMETNVYGPLLLMQAAVPLMKQNQYGRIVNLSSGMGQLSDMQGGYTGYRLSKSSLNALTRIVAAEVRSENILVNTLCPGWVKTDMGGSGATRSVEQGADTAVWLAMLPDGGPSGQFFRDRQVIPW